MRSVGTWGCCVNGVSGVRAAFDEAAAIEVIAEMFVEGVGVWAVIAAGDFDTDAVVRPGEFFGCRNEQAADAASPMIGRNHETGDASKEAVGVKERDAMKRQKTDRALVDLGDEDGCANGVQAFCDAALHLRWGRGIAERGEQFGEREGVVASRGANTQGRMRVLRFGALIHG
jgi:hypothetical protein